MRTTFVPMAVDSSVPRRVIRIDDRLLGHREQIQYVLEEVSARLRCAVVLVADGNAGFDVEFAADEGSPDGLWFDQRCYDGNSPFSAARVSGKTMWVPDGFAPGNRIDHIGTIFRLLTLLDETAVDKRNRLGVFPVSALPQARYQTRMVSLVENHCEMLARELGIDGAGAGKMWPEDYRYCVLLTHDIDAAALGTAGEIVTNLAKAMMRRDSRRLGLAKLGLRYRGMRDKDPMFTFPAWESKLGALGINSAFYASILRHSGRDRHDVKSDIFHYDESQLEVVRRMIESGSEIGLHASIGSKSNLEYLLVDKQRIEQSFGVPVHGVRHHYWSIDWAAPYKTYRLHENAGFRYDLSIAWQDSAGLRAGTSLPFRPYDHDRRRPLNLYVIPTAVLDDHVIQCGEQGCSLGSDFAAIKKEIATVGGVLCIDLHAESASNLYPYEGHATAVLAEMQNIIAEGDAWVTTPWKLIEYWHTKSVQYSERLKAPL